ARPTPRAPRGRDRGLIPRLDGPAEDRAQSPAAIAVGRPSEGRHPLGRFDSSRSLPMIAATQLRVGNLVIYNGKPHRVTAMVHRTPGNLRGFVQATLVNIENGAKNEYRFSSEEKVERASLDEHTLQYSYKGGDTYNFMNTESYEMVELDKDVLGENAGYLKEG